jgi:hypothetical protein
MLLSGCGGSGSSTPTPDAPTPTPPPVDNTPTYTPPTGELIAWARALPGAGFEGSATHCDLDNDGALEAVVPIAVVDHPESSYMVAMSGDSGNMLWQSAMGDASFGYPLCVDVNDDGVFDVLAGGRTRDMMALSGVDGTPIWRFTTQNPDIIEGNTYSAVAETEHPETIFFTSGGGGGNQRLEGRLFAVDMSGNLLANWSEPQNREIYTTPALYRSNEDVLYLAVGSGGETLPGEMFILTYNENNPSFTVKTQFSSTCDIAGWIASPVFADLTGDGTPEVLAADYCGAVTAFSLNDGTQWTQTSDQLYATSNPVVTDLNGDGTLDVIALFSGLNWSLPDTYSNEVTQVLAINGANGEVLWTNNFNTLAPATPVAADYNGDQIDDIFVLGFSGLFNDSAFGELTILSGVDGGVLIANPMSASSGTPALGDLNNNGSLDLLYTETPSIGAEQGGVVLLEFPGVIPPTHKNNNSFRGMPVHNGQVQ